MSVRARDQAQSNYLALYGGDYGTWTDIAATRQEPPTMQFTIERSALLAAVKLARVAVAARTSLPVLTHLLLDARPATGDTPAGLVITATDLEIGLVVSAPAVVKEPGRATIPATLAAAMLAQCAAPTLVVALDKGKVRLTGSGTKLALPALDPDDFPALGSGNAPVPLADCDAGQFRAAVARVAFAVADGDGSRPMLGGVNLAFGPDTLTLSACDGYRLARTTLPIHRAHSAADGAEDLAVLIPAKILTGIIGALPDGQLAIGRDRNAIVLTTATATGHARTLDGTFPDLDHLIPREYTLTRVVPRAEWRDAARLAHLAAAPASGKDGFVGLDLDIDATGITVAGSDESEALVTVATPPAEFAHDGAMRGDGGVQSAVKTTVNAAYLIDALGALGGESVTLRVGTPGGLLLLSPHGDAEPDALHGIMPMVRGAR